MDGICDVPVISEVCSFIGDTTAAVISAPFQWLAQAAGAAAQWLFETVWGLFETTTFVDLTSPGYLSVFRLLFGIAVFVMLIFFFLQLLTGLIRRDSSALKYALLGLARAILGTFLVVSLTTLLLEITDQLTIGIVHAAGSTMTELGDKVAVLVIGLTTITVAAPGAGVILMIFLAFLAIAGAAIVWFSLLVRKSLILVAVALAPLALSGTVWEHTKGWFGKWASFLIALIISKLVIVVIILVAVNQLAAPIDLDIASISDPISGIVLMFIAAFAPYMTYKLVSFIGFDMYAAMSVEQEAKQAVNRPVPLPSKPGKGDGAKKVLDGSGDQGSRNPGGGASPSGAGGGGGSSPSSAGGGGGQAAARTGGSGTNAGAGASSGTAGGAGAGAGAAAAGGVAAGVIVVAESAKSAAEAGPRAGAAVAGAAEQHAGGSQSSAPPPSTPVRQSPPPVAPPATPKKGAS